MPCPCCPGDFWKQCFHCYYASHQIFSVRPQYRPEKFETAPITGTVILELCLRKLGQGNHVIMVNLSFSNSFVFNMISVHAKTKSWRFQILQVWRAYSAKLCFLDGLAWTVSLTVEIKPANRFPVRAGKSRRANRVDEREKKEFFRLNFTAHQNKAVLSNFAGVVHR